MQQMPIADLKAVAADLATTGERVRVLWQEDESLAFVARGREVPERVPHRSGGRGDADDTRAT